MSDTKRDHQTSDLRESVYFVVTISETRPRFVIQSTTMGVHHYDAHTDTAETLHSAIISRAAKDLGMDLSRSAILFMLVTKNDLS